MTIGTNVIYETRGKAREYCELAANLYRGCGHACVYCYAPRATFTDIEKFLHASPRKGILTKLERDARILKEAGETRPILMSFTCDPYQPIDGEYQLTRSGIQILKNNGLNVRILTKGGTIAERDFDLLDQRDSFGATLTTLDDSESLIWEPEAALPAERIANLKNAHASGITTWVSLEPVINPAATLEIIRRVHMFVDVFKVGILNYHPLSKTIDWSKFARDAKMILDSLQCRYYLKADLRKWLPGEL